MTKYFFFVLTLVFVVSTVMYPSVALAACDCYCSGVLQQRGVANDVACSTLCGPGNGPDCRAEEDGDKPSLTNPIGEVDVRIVIGNAIQTALGVVGSIALAIFIYGGFLWMTAGGNSDRVTKGRNTLIWASIGLLVIFSSYAILTFVFGVIQGTT